MLVYVIVAIAMVLFSALYMMAMMSIARSGSGAANVPPQSLAPPAAPVDSATGATDETIDAPAEKPSIQSED